MTGIGELRVKESDRIAAIVAGLQANGVTVVRYRRASTNGVGVMMAWVGAGVGDAASVVGSAAGVVLGAAIGGLVGRSSTVSGSAASSAMT